MTANVMREMWDDMQHRATARTHCSKDKASVHGSHALPTELLGCPEIGSG